MYRKDASLGLNNNVRTSRDASIGGAIASKGASPEVMSMEVPAAVPTTPRSLWPKPTLVKEVPNPNKDKQKKPVLVHESPRKHVAT